MIAEDITLEWVQERCYEDGDCLIWKLATAKGRPITKMRVASGKRTTRQIARIVWSLRNGPAPEDKVVSFSCGNPRCLEHLELIDRAEVIRRLWGRSDIRARLTEASKTSARARGKMDMERARQIRDSGETLEAVAAREGISQTWASLIRRGLAWREDRNPFAGLL